jgi:uncharacterized protein (TIGR02996 family)
MREAFLADICECPSDDAPRLIFADWLEEHGDPEWARFIRLQCRLACLATDGPQRALLMAQERGMWEEFGERLWETLPELPDLAWNASDDSCELAFERGFAGQAFVDTLATLRQHKGLFRTLAPVCHVHIECLEPAEAESLGGPDDPPGLVRLSLGHHVGVDLLRAVAASTLARRLESLELCNVHLPPQAVVFLVAEPAFAGLRRLDLSGNLLFSVEGVAEALAEPNALAGLADLSLESSRLADQDACILASSPRLLRLERLELWSNRIGEAGIRAFVEGPDRPRLTHFSLGSNKLGDGGAQALASWPGLQRFRRIELANNEVSPAFIEALAREGVLDEVAFLRLIECGPDRDEAVLWPAHLSVYNNGLTEKGVAALLRSPHRGPLDHLELWSKALAGDRAAHPRLRNFFKGDSRVC